MTSLRPRVALFGGSFDPVHTGHTAIARAAQQQARLDEVIFVPAAQSPLKDWGPVASGSQRLEMLRIALKEEPWATISPWELDRPGPGFSWQTVAHFKASRGAEVEWFWLMGVDQWEQLERWQRWEFLAESLTFLVFGREGKPPRPKPSVRALFLEGHFPGSSTAIREASQAGREWRHLVNPEVADFIEDAGLYGGN